MQVYKKYKPYVDGCKTVNSPFSQKVVFFAMQKSACCLIL